jgi:hypothetical protein
MVDMTVLEESPTDVRELADGAAPVAEALPVNSPFDFGCDDARAFRPMRQRMARTYYEGYVFACAVDGLS